MTKAPTEAEAIADREQSTTARGFTSGLVEVETPGEESFHDGCGGYLASGGRQAGRVCVDCWEVVEDRVLVRTAGGSMAWQRRGAFLGGRP
jgi:hypothetical protein